MHHAKLTAITKPVGLGFDSPSDLLAYYARISNAANQANHATAPRLLAYLIRSQEWSPFEMCNMVLEITTTRDISRQILRHRSFSFQEFSQRYAEVKTQPVFRDARLQDKKNRQNSIVCDDDKTKKWWDKQQASLSRQSVAAYEDALSRGIAKEVARIVLSEGMTETKMYMNGSVRSWIHYTDLRWIKPGTQHEHRLIAESAREILIEQYPAFEEAFNIKDGK